MTPIWRIDKASRPKEDAFSGEGGVRCAGRWNRQGTRIVYTAGSLALAALEKFVHTGDDGREMKLVSYEVEIPDAVKIHTLKKPEVPPDWKNIPAPRSTMDIGADWASKAETVALKVPSVVVEDEWNFILNPLHPDFKKLKIKDPKPFRFDGRLWKD